MMKMNEKSSGAKIFARLLILVISLLFLLNAAHVLISLDAMSFWGYPYVGLLAQEQFKAVKLRNLRCPRFIADGETKSVSVEVVNTGKEPLKPFIQAVFSSTLAEDGIRYEEISRELQPGQSTKVIWEVKGEEFTRRNFGVARVFLSRDVNFSPTKSIYCDTVRLNVPGFDSEAAGLGLFAVLSVLTLMLAYCFTRTDSVSQKLGRPRTGLIYLLAVMALLTIASLSGAWLLGLVSLVLEVLGAFIFLQAKYH